MDTGIYVITDRVFTKPDDSEYEGIYHPLHLAYAKPDNTEYELDDTGDNISDKHDIFGKLTGLYWVWKNTGYDLIGICEYNSYFVENEDFIRKGRIEELLNEYRFILPYSTKCDSENTQEFYGQKLIHDELEICRTVLLDKFPDYVEAFEFCMEADLFTDSHMLITHRDRLDEYCTWLFDILFEISERISADNPNNVGTPDSMECMSEILLRVWLLYNQYSVFEMENRQIDPADRANQIREVELKRQTVALILKDLAVNYHNRNYVDLVDSPPLYNNVSGKIPIWVCWWQGIDDMPELVKVCVDSIKTNIPGDICEFHLITFENVFEYVSFPQWIIDKYEKGAISLTFLSDVLRMGLLYRYGGMWIDATYYLTAPLDRRIFDSDFYTQRLRKGIWKADVVQGRWVGNFIYGKRGNVLFQFALNAFYMYWFTQDTLIDYFLIDYVIDLAYSNIQEVHDMIEDCEYTQPQVMEFYKVLDRIYDHELYNRLTEDTNVFKLNRRLSPVKETITGKKTFYGHIFEKFQKKS